MINLEMNKEILNTIRLQNLLMEVTSSNINEKKSELQEFLFTPEILGSEETFSKAFFQFVSNTAYIISYVSSQIFVIAELCKLCFDDFLKPFNPRKQILKFLPKDSSNYRPYYYMYYIYYHLQLFDQDLFISDICNYLRQELLEFSDNINKTIAFYCWFIPQIEKEDPELSNILNELFKEQIQSQKLSKPFQLFYSMLPTLKKNNWEEFDKIASLGISTDPIAYIIYKDDIEQLQKLIFKQFDINHIIQTSILTLNGYLYYNPTLIQASVFFGSEKCFNFLLKHGANINKTLYYDRELWVFAIAGGNLRIIQKLEEMKIESSNKLFYAAFFHRNELFKRYHLEGYSLSVYHDIFGSIINMAIRSNNIEIVKYCIENGIDCNIIFENELAPLHIAATLSYIDSIIFLLQCPNINVNITTTSRKTPLHYAAEFGNVETIKLLLRHPDIQINQKDKNMQSPLMLATIHGDPNVLKILLNDRRIEYETMDSNGMIPLHWAVAKNRKGIFRILMKKYHYDINAKSDNGITPLHLAVLNNHLDLVKFLLTFPQIDINSKTDDGESPLHFAVKKGFLDIEALLLENSMIDINIQSNNGSTPLHFSVIENNIKAAKLLLMHSGINLIIKNVLSIILKMDFILI